MNKIFNIAIVGLGQVGIYLFNELNTKKKDIELKTGKRIKIVAVSARNINKKRKFKVDKKLFYKNPLNIFQKHKIDILFEAIGQSGGVSKKIVETALRNKTHVITPNKALISKHGNDLSKLAEKNNVNLEFEASVAGGIPVLRAIKESLTTNKISKVYGILNGTSNYILSEMENSNKNFYDVLKKAQQLGYAEPGNPKLDLNGFDAFAKIKILSALSFNTKISKKLKGQNIHNQERIDALMINLDGTRQKSKLGANAILAVSMAVKKLSAKTKKLPLYKTFLLKNNFKLPFPLMNIINGGVHANNGLRIQEFMIRPDRAKSFSEAMRICFIVIKNLSKIIKSKGLSTSVGDEGGFAPMISNNTQALDLIVLAIKKSGLQMVEMLRFV